MLTTLFVKGKGLMTLSVKVKGFMTLKILFNNLIELPKIYTYSQIFILLSITTMGDKNQVACLMGLIKLIFSILSISCLTIAV
jgi:hypothetical protein